MAGAVAAVVAGLLGFVVGGVDVDVVAMVVGVVVVGALVVVGAAVVTTGSGSASDTDTTCTGPAEPGLRATSATAVAPSKQNVTLRATRIRRRAGVAGMAGVSAATARCCSGCCRYVSRPSVVEPVNGNHTTTARSHSAWLMIGATSVPRHAKRAPQKAPPVTAASTSTALRSQRWTAA